MRLLNNLGRNLHEPEKPKVVLHKSFWIALSRCAVHLVPTFNFVWPLFLNYRTAYLGPGLSSNQRYDALYLALFQVAAKIQEMLCLASLGTVLLQVLRHDLLHGNGVPLGLFASHLWFQQPNSLLNPEYLAAAQLSLMHIWNSLVTWIRGPQVDRRDATKSSARIRLTLLLLILVLLAALIGPLTAVLLIPRIQEFPAGGSQYFLNVTAQDLWPDNVSSDTEHEACFWANATQYSVCPSGGYPSLLIRNNFNVMYDTTGIRTGMQAELALGNDNFLILDPLEIIPAMLSSGLAKGDAWASSTYACQPNAFSVILQQILIRDWYSAANDGIIRNGPLITTSRLKLATNVSASASSTYPFTNVKCSLPQNLSLNAVSAQFHFIESMPLSESGWSGDTTTKLVNISRLRRDPTPHVRTQWIPLPIEIFGPVSTGLLFELPWSLPSDSRLAIACTVSASWTQGNIMRVAGSDYSAWYASHSERPLGRVIRTDLSGPNDPSAVTSNRLIYLDPKWLDLLTPAAPDPPSTSDSWRPTTLENIFYGAGFESLMHEMRTMMRFIHVNGSCALASLDPNLTDMELWAAQVCLESDKRTFIEWTIARLISDGLSRRLSWRVFETHPALRAWFATGIPRNDDYNARLLRGASNNLSENAVAIEPTLSEFPQIVVQRLDITVQGYGYRASSTTDYLATFVIAIYLLLSLSHIVWCLSHRVTSSSWDTATELILLALNSLPVSVLKGTSAQIHRWDTYQRIMKIRALTPKRNHDEPNNVIEDTNSESQQLHLQLLVQDELEDEMESRDAGPESSYHLDNAATTSMDSLRTSTLSQSGTMPHEHNNPRPQVIKEGVKYW